MLRVTIFGMGRLGSQLARSLALAGVGAITAVDRQTVTADDLASDAWFAPEHLGVNRAEATGKLLRAVNAALIFRAAVNPGDQGTLEKLLSDCDLAVLCPDRYDPDEYDQFNRAALASKTTWTSARLAGFEFHVGPTVIPGQTSCYNCFRLRLKSNVDDYDEDVLIENFRRQGLIREQTLSITPGAGLLSLEVLKALTWFSPPVTCAHLYSLNLLTMRSALHPVLKIPRCSECGRLSMPRPTIHAWQQTQADPLS